MSHFFNKHLSCENYFQEFSNLNDLDQIIELDSKYFPRPWTARGWQDLVDYPQGYLLSIIRSPEQIIGFLLFKCIEEEMLAHLLKILVVPNFQNRGIAKEAFLEELSYLKQLGLKKVHLEVEEGNIQGINLYHSLNFELIHKGQNYYNNGVNALIFQRKID